MAQREEIPLLLISNPLEAFESRFTNFVPIVVVATFGVCKALLFL